MSARAAELRASGRHHRPITQIGPLASTLPATLGLVLFLAAPILTFFVYSFLTSRLFSVGAPFTLDNYRDAVSSDVNGTLALNSAVIGVVVASVTLLIGLPVAYWLRYSAGRWQIPVLFLITASMFASYLVRVYAWRTVLGEQGILNEALEWIGVTDEPLGFILFSRFAVAVALVHIFVPYVILVLFAAFRSLEPRYLECAQDLGAGWLVRWCRVVLPLMAAPALSVFLLVLVLSASDYVTPQFLGGTDGSLLGVQIQNAFKGTGNWGLGSALAFLMLAAFACCYGIVALGLRLMQLDRVRWGT